MFLNSAIMICSQDTALQGIYIDPASEDSPSSAVFFSLLSESWLEQIYYTSIIGRTWWYVNIY